MIVKTMGVGENTQRECGIKSSGPRTKPRGTIAFKGREAVVEKETIKETEKKQSETFEVNQESEVSLQTKWEFHGEEKSPVSDTAETSARMKTSSHIAIGILLVILGKLFSVEW